MIEDEQILLQNLSSELLTLPPHPSPLSSHQIQAEPFNLEQCLGQVETVSTKKSPRKFYVDWSKADNHHYFTKQVEEQQEETPPHTPPLHDYSQLTMKLEIALALIKKHQAARSNEGKCPQKRSQSNEPRRQGEMRAMTKTTGTFKVSAIQQRKQSMQLRFKTEGQEEQRTLPLPTPSRLNRMEKYHAEQAIAEEVGGRQSFKENTLRKKFLQSIAMWQEKKQRRIQERIERELRLTMQGVTFTPEINPRSRQIMKKKGIIAPIYEREHREKKRELTERFNVEQKTYRIKP